MRIAIFTETFLPSTDGIVTRLCATLRHLQHAGHEVLLFAPAGGPATYASATVIGLPTFRFLLYPDKKFSLPTRHVAQPLLDWSPDLVHVLNPAFLGIAGLYYARRFGFPLLASYHTNVPIYAHHYRLDWVEPVLWWYFRTLHNQARMNLCTSQAMVGELNVHGFCNVALWDRGVDTQVFGLAEAAPLMHHTWTQGDAEGKILLYVGRLAAEKQIQQLRLVLDANPHIHLVIVGDGPYRSDLERVFAGSHAHFTGYLHGPILAQAYATADGFIFPSTTETLGLVLYEAMASGLPILAADSPPTREVLESGEAGLIYPGQDSDALLRFVHELLYDEPRRIGLQKRGRQIAAAMDWSGPTRQLIGFYQSVIQTEMQTVHTTTQRGSRIS
ncbi:glycosyltransferase family 1 protein [Alicyclobacillaceae bacterium I2511]|nr:glycosyltransferase family 1 protein [Alicyclobacillaceae bacterium I2511]